MQLLALHILFYLVKYVFLHFGSGHLCDVHERSWIWDSWMGLVLLREAFLSSVTLVICKYLLHVRLYFNILLGSQQVCIYLLWVFLSILFPPQAGFDRYHYFLSHSDHHDLDESDRQRVVLDRKAPSLSYLYPAPTAWYFPSPHFAWFVYSACGSAAKFFEFTARLWIISPIYSSNHSFYSSSSHVLSPPLSSLLTLSVVPNSRTQRVGCAGVGTRHDHQLVHSSFSPYFLAFLWLLPLWASGTAMSIPAHQPAKFSSSRSSRWSSSSFLAT